MAMSEEELAPEWEQEETWVQAPVPVRWQQAWLWGQVCQAALCEYATTLLMPRGRDRELDRAFVIDDLWTVTRTA